MYRPHVLQYIRLKIETNKKMNKKWEKSNDFAGVKYLKNSKN